MAYERVSLVAPKIYSRHDVVVVFGPINKTSGRIVLLMLFFFFFHHVFAFVLFVRVCAKDWFDIDKQSNVECGSQPFFRE